MDSTQSAAAVSRRAQPRARGPVVHPHMLHSALHPLGYYITLHYTILYYIMLYYTLLYYIILYYPISYYIILQTYIGVILGLYWDNGKSNGN